MVFPISCSSYEEEISSHSAKYRNYKQLISLGPWMCLYSFFSHWLMALFFKIILSFFLSSLLYIVWNPLNFSLKPCLFSVPSVYIYMGVWFNHYMIFILYSFFFLSHPVHKYVSLSFSIYSLSLSLSLSLSQVIPGHTFPTHPDQIKVTLLQASRIRGTLYNKEQENLFFTLKNHKLLIPTSPQSRVG